MQPFTYQRPATLAEALLAAAEPGSAILAGGTTMVDLMRGDLAWPQRLIDIGHLPGLSEIDTSGPVLRLGALVRMADAAEHPTLLADYPALAESLQLAASQQIRNAATLAGNILQRTRCSYFRAHVPACNKLTPGSGCSAQGGQDRDMALLAGSEHCIATYPGDFGTALAAFDTAVEITAASGTRRIGFAEFHRAPGDDPSRETVLAPGEIVTAILIDATPAGRRSTYVKLRDRQSYAYAVASAAVALEMDGETITAARVSIGGLATKPWRAHAAEAVLTGKTLTQSIALEAGAAALAAARPGRHNAFKIELGRRVVARAALTAAQRN